MKVTMSESPTPHDWKEVYRRAMVTVGSERVKDPDQEWKHAILKAKHSPIRRLFFSFYIECPYWVSVHLVRHIHAQPYVRSQRNDRQSKYDRTKAPQDETVEMIWDMNAEELMTIAEKRLCGKASPETREVVEAMCRRVEQVYPEFKGLFAPHCKKYGCCIEMKPCK